MKYRKWNPRTKAKIILECYEKKIPPAENCSKYNISQSQYYNWLKEFQANAYKVFVTEKTSNTEKKLIDENKELKNIIADLTIELKKSEHTL